MDEKSIKYYLILGTNPSLSLAEIYHFFKNKDDFFDIEVASKDLVFLKSKKKIDVDNIIKKLGGVKKIGEILEESKKINENVFLNLIDKSKIKESSKFNFGFSFYNDGKLPLSNIAMKMKKSLKDNGISSRWVASKENSLSSVVVEQNKLTQNGVDFFIFFNKNRYFIGRTLVVQDFKGLSRRDFGRPARDDVSGMLPPKLAQIMLNLAEPDESTVLLDPFCGSGTVLMEALLMGINSIYGSDLSKKAVEDTRKNIHWLKRTNDFNESLFLNEIDSTKISSKIKNKTIDAIVTEPYLGPQRGEHNIEKTVGELENLYSKSLSEFSKIIKNKGRVVMVWPIFVSREGNKKKFFLDKVNLGKFKIEPLLPDKYLDYSFINLSKKGGIIYGRPGQKVWREILLLKLS